MFDPTCIQWTQNDPVVKKATYKFIFMLKKIEICF